MSLFRVSFSQTNSSKYQWYEWYDFDTIYDLIEHIRYRQMMPEPDEITRMSREVRRQDSPSPISLPPADEVIEAVH